MEPKRIRVLGMILLLLFGGSVLYVASKNHVGSSYGQINSFEECIDAGYAVRHGDPPICVTIEGESFIKKQN